MKYFSLAGILLVVFLTGSCASYPANVSGEGRLIPDDFAGIVHAGWTRSQEEYNHLEYLGAKWILHTFSWSSIEPNQGEWDFQRYDDLVDTALASGVKVLGVLAYDVRWIHDENPSRYIPSDKLPFYLEYVRRTVEHFRGRVDAWCIWNEPNTTRFWTGTNEGFFELTRQAADVVKETDSGVILLGGAVNRGYFGLPEKFIRGLFESGAMDKVDGVAFHPYELNPARSLTLYEKFRKIVSDYGFEDKIWITEAGYPTGGRYPTKIK